MIKLSGGPETNNLPKILPSFLDCIQATEVLYEALRVGEVISLECLREIGRIDAFPAPLTDNIVVLNTETGARLEFNFFENRLITAYQGEIKQEKLSCVLGIIADVAEVFIKIQRSAAKRPTTQHYHPHFQSVQNGDTILSLECHPKSNSSISVNSDDETSSMELQLAEALSHATAMGETESAKRKDWKLIIEGKESVAIYFDSERIVFSGMMRQSSTPMKMLAKCSHLFSDGFVKEMAPVLGIRPQLKHLLVTVHKIYLGRCLLSVIKGSDEHPQQVYQRELMRIVTLITLPGCDLYTEPLRVNANKKKDKTIIHNIVICENEYLDIDLPD